MILIVLQIYAFVNVFLGSILSFHRMKDQPDFTRWTSKLTRWVWESAWRAGVWSVASRWKVDGIGLVAAWSLTDRSMESLSHDVIPLKCADIDECENPSSNVCDHTCVNTAGSFLCHCRSGFMLAPDQHSCIPVHNCEFCLRPSIHIVEHVSGPDRLVFGFFFRVAVSSSGKSDTLMSSGTCSFTCQDFLNMKNSLLQLKLKLANRADKPSSGRAGKFLDVPCHPGLSGPPGGPGLPGNTRVGWQEYKWWRMEEIWPQKKKLHITNNV